MCLLPYEAIVSNMISVAERFAEDCGCFHIPLTSLAATEIVVSHYFLFYTIFNRARDGRGTSYARIGEVNWWKGTNGGDWVGTGVFPRTRQRQRSPFAATVKI